MSDIHDTVSSSCLLGCLFASSFWGPQTGANPTDRAKRGSKRHLICDGRGIPLVEAGRSGRIKLHELPRLHPGTCVANVRCNGQRFQGIKELCPQRASSMKRYVPPVATFLLVLGVLLACSTVGYHDSVRRFRKTTLSQDLWVMRQSIDNYTKDREQAPQSLQDLVDGKYLREIPTDPLTGKQDWVPHFGTVVLDKEHTTFGIDNVHSSSEHNGW